MYMVYISYKYLYMSVNVLYIEIDLDVTHLFINFDGLIRVSRVSLDKLHMSYAHIHTLCV